MLKNAFCRSRILQGFEQVLLELRVVHPKPPAREEKKRFVVDVVIAQVANQPATRAARQEPADPRKPLLSAKQVRDKELRLQNN